MVRYELFGANHVEKIMGDTKQPCEHYELEKWKKFGEDRRGNARRLSLGLIEIYQ
jgi:hypothetical protein